MTRPPALLLAAALVLVPVLSGCGESAAEASCKAYPYASTAQLRFPPPADFYGSVVASGNYMKVDRVADVAGNYAALATSAELMTQVVDRLGLTLSPVQLRTLATATGRDEGARGIAVTLTIRQQDPAAAQAVVEGTVDLFRSYVAGLDAPTGTSGYRSHSAVVLIPASYNSRKAACPA